MKPTRPEMQNWWQKLNASDRQAVEQDELTFAQAARPLLKGANLIDDSTTDDEVMKALRMRF